MSAVRSDEDVVHASEGRNPADATTLTGVDNVHEGASTHDGHVHFGAVGRDRDVVGASGQWDLGHDAERGRGHDVERVVHFVAEVVLAPVRMARDTMWNLYARDHVDDFVGRRVDDVDVVAGRVRLDDPNGSLLGAERSHQDQEPQCQHAESRLTITHHGAPPVADANAGISYSPSNAPD